jgi:hypothetical protein
MRQRFIGGALLAVAAVAAGAGSGQANPPSSLGAPANTGFDAPLNTYPTVPIPTGAAGAAGFYTAVEFVTLTQTRTLGTQTVAYRGYVDSSGQITGVPGTYVGSGQAALSTDQLGRTTFQPGYQVELGYKFEDGTRIYGSFLQLFDAHYSSGATLVPPFFRSRPDLADTFLVSGVSNFTPQFAGPSQKTAFDTQPGNGGFNTYGIWNGAQTMDIKFTARYQQAEIGARIPMFQTDYSRVYGLAAGRFAWFFERFAWRAQDFDVNGNSGAIYAADYSNTLSQRMYGPVIGCGHEIFLANQFSLSTDLTVGALLNVIKERAKYELEDKSTESKWGNNEYSIVPNANANINLWWYPIEGVQIRVGYQAMTYFNTRRMQDPIGFNFDNIDPRYDVQWFRIIHGVNVGFGLFF